MKLAYVFALLVTIFFLSMSLISLAKELAVISVVLMGIIGVIALVIPTAKVHRNGTIKPNPRQNSNFRFFRPSDD